MAQELLTSKLGVEMREGIMWHVSSLFVALILMLSSITACDPQFLEQFKQEDEETTEETVRFAESDATSDRQAAAFEDLAGRTLFMFRAPDGLVADPMNRCSHHVEDVEFSDDYMQCARRLFGTGFYGDLDRCAGLDPRNSQPIPTIAEEQCTIECKKSEDAKHTYEDCRKVCVKSETGESAVQLDEDRNLLRYQLCLGDCKQLFPQGPENDPNAGLCFKRCEEIMVNEIVPGQVNLSCEEQCKAGTLADPAQFEMCLTRCREIEVPPTPALPWQEECRIKCKTEFSSTNDAAAIDHCLAGCGDPLPQPAFDPIDQCRYECKEKLADADDPAVIETCLASCGGEPNSANVSPNPAPVTCEERCKLDFEANDGTRDPLAIERCLAACSDGNPNLPVPQPLPAACEERCKQEFGNNTDPASFQHCIDACRGFEPLSTAPSCEERCKGSFEAEQAPLCLEMCRRCQPGPAPIPDEDIVARCQEQCNAVDPVDPEGRELCLRECKQEYLGEQQEIPPCDVVCKELFPPDGTEGETASVQRCLEAAGLMVGEDSCSLRCHDEFADEGIEAIERCRSTKCNLASAPPVEDPCLMQCRDRKSEGPEVYEGCLQQCLPAPEPVDPVMYCPEQCGKDFQARGEEQVLACLQGCPGFQPPAEEQCKLGCDHLSDPAAIDRCQQQCAGNAAPALECELRCADGRPQTDDFLTCVNECRGPADRSAYCEISCRQAMPEGRPEQHQQCTELCLQGRSMSEAVDIDANLEGHKECLSSCERGNASENWVADDFRQCLKRCEVENLSFANYQIPEEKRKDVFEGCLEGLFLLMQVCGEFAPAIGENSQLTECLETNYGTVGPR